MTTKTACALVGESKECRLCGVDEDNNINIFSNSFDSRGLATKINTVYPIVLYQNDPLPKNICQACIFNVNYMYNEIEKVLKLNNKWIRNVRDLQSEHSYNKVLDIIKHSKRSTRKTIRSSLGEDICEHSMNRKLMGINSESSSKKRKKLKRKSDGAAALTADEDVPNSASTQITEAQTPERACQINDLKTQLELNGCTLLAVPVKKCKTQHYPIQCAYCPLTCESLHELAIHQVEHMQLKLTKIYEKKFLVKELRRGRLMNFNGRKCIRCLNCWRVFDDNAAILVHWSLGECEYYCRVCGKEYPLTPKMLREHVPAAHGVRYRSTKLPTVGRDMSANHEPKDDFTLQLDKGDECTANKQLECQMPPSTEPLKNVTCNVCFQVFKNFKARNSHMRIHKASTQRDEVPLTQPHIKPTNTQPATESQDNNNGIPQRSVRIKFVNIHSGGNAGGPRIKVKSIHELQNAPTNPPDLRMGCAIIHQPLCEVKKEPNEN